MNTRLIKNTSFETFDDFQRLVIHNHYDKAEKDIEDFLNKEQQLDIEVISNNPVKLLNPFFSYERVRLSFKIDQDVFRKHYLSKLHRTRFKVENLTYRKIDLDDHDKIAEMTSDFDRNISFQCKHQNELVGWIQAKKKKKGFCIQRIYIVPAMRNSKVIILLIASALRAILEIDPFPKVYFNYPSDRIDLDRLYRKHFTKYIQKENIQYVYYVKNSDLMEQNRE